MKSVNSIRNLRWLALTMLIVAFSIGLVSAQSDANMAGLVIMHGNGEVLPYCVTFEADEISGLELLQQANNQWELDYIPEGGGRFGGTIICSIDNEGCNPREDSCFCECEGTDTCRYWSYWYLKTDGWDYAQFGVSASESNVRHGDVQGWTWSEGVINETADSMPPQTTFNEICNIPTETPTQAPTDTPTTEASPTEIPTEAPTTGPTTTPTGTATATRTPTAAPSATGTATPSVTPTTFSAPIINHFGVDRNPINFGESATLSWDVANSENVILHIDGTQEIMAAQGSRVVSPARTTTYVLTAQNQGVETGAETVVTVNPAFATPTPAVVEMPTETPTLIPTPIPTEMPLPTETSIPTETPLPPTATEIPTETPTSTPAPTELPIETPLPTETPTALTVAIDQTGPDASDKALALPALPSDEAVEDDSDRLRQVMVVGGVIFVVGIPLLFAGIWLIVYSVWKRKDDKVI